MIALGLHPRPDRRPNPRLPFVASLWARGFCFSYETESIRSGPIIVNAPTEIVWFIRLVDLQALDAIVDAYETKIGPHNGAKVVARA